MSLRLGSISSICSTAFDANEIPISFDHVETARFLLDFLSDISSKPELSEGPLVEYAVQRYEKYWLPLVAKHPDRLLPAPIDIEWVWHCHMLCPEAYHTDCSNIVGNLIDHHVIDRAQRKELIKESERLWKNEYADVPFTTCDAFAARFDQDFISALTYNLVQAISRQKTFYYQVSLPHYRDEKFLNIALMRYKKFLFLKCHNPGVFLVPCYDSDLLWHTHLLHPSIYKSDTETYLGYLLPHDDSVNDRSPGSKLSLAEAKTRNLWRKIFNEKFSHFGAMYRGDAPNSSLSPMSKEDVYKICTKQADVLIEKIRISGLPVGKTYKLKLCYNTGYQNFNRCLFVTENIATVKGNSRTFEDSTVDAHFQFDTRYNDKLIASLQMKSGKLCLGTSDIVGEGKIDLQKKIQPLNNKGLSANDDIDCGDGLSIGVVWSCSAPTLGPCMLRLEPGEYQSFMMPEDRESLWGPVPLPRLPPGIESMCSVAVHKLFNHTRRVVFTVRMIHSEPLLMSAIHVYYGDKLMALAHLVVGDQLPLPTSVSDTKKSVTLNPKEGQRAVIIKNHKGDWGIAIGWWDGFQRRLQGRRGSCSEGHLEVKFFHLPNNRWHFVSFERLYSLATSKFEIGDCVVEFDIGFIEINSQSAEIAENLALIFSVALIHVLCQPRPPNWAPKLTWSKSDEEALPKLGGSEEIALLLAAGVLVATPCNHTIRNLFKNKKQAFGEGTSSRRENQREADDQYEQSSNSSVVLHEAEVSTGWADEWAGSGNVVNVDAPDTPSVVGGPLTVIQEQTDVENEEAVEESAQENYSKAVYRVDNKAVDVQENSKAVYRVGNKTVGLQENSKAVYRVGNKAVDWQENSQAVYRVGNKAVDSQENSQAVYRVGNKAVDLQENSQAVYRVGNKAVDLQENSQAVYRVGNKAVDLQENSQAAYRVGNKAVDLQENRQAVYRVGNKAVDLQENSQAVYRVGNKAVDLQENRHAVYRVGNKAIDEDIARSAVMLTINDSVEVKDIEDSFQNLDTLKTNEQENVAHDEEAEEADEDEAASDQQSEGVFEVEEYSLGAESQADVFGDGEDDSDEVELDETEENCLGPVSSGDDSVFVFSHSLESNLPHKSFPSPLEPNGGFINDVDSYYDEFYNMSGDETVNGFDRSDHTIVNHSDRAGRSLQHSNDADAKNLTDESSNSSRASSSSKVKEVAHSDRPGHRKRRVEKEALLGRSSSGNWSYNASGLLGGSRDHYGDGGAVPNDRGHDGLGLGRVSRNEMEGTEGGGCINGSRGCVNGNSIRR